MVTKKDLIIAVLVTFCLTAIIFMVMPISANNYDPMLDYNHDGKISLSDLVLFAQSYGTTGDPTINVNVTNWGDQYTVEYIGIYNFTFFLFGGIPTVYYISMYNTRINCSGYSEMTILLSPNSASNSNVTFSIYLDSVSWHPTYSTDNASYSENIEPSFNNFTIYDGNIIPSAAPSPTLIETKAPYCIPHWTWAYPFPASYCWAAFDVYVYLRNE